MPKDTHYNDYETEVTPSDIVVGTNTDEEGSYIENEEFRNKENFTYPFKEIKKIQLTNLIYNTLNYLKANTVLTGSNPSDDTDTSGNINSSPKRLIDNDNEIQKGLQNTQETVNSILDSFGELYTKAQTAIELINSLLDDKGNIIDIGMVLDALRARDYIEGGEIDFALSRKADLDENNKIEVSQLPALAITDVFTVDSIEEMLELNAQKGDHCYIASGTDSGEVYILIEDNPKLLDNWKIIESMSGVNKNMRFVEENDGRKGVIFVNDVVFKKRVEFVGAVYSQVSAYSSRSKKNRILKYEEDTDLIKSAVDYINDIQVVSYYYNDENYLNEKQDKYIGFIADREEEKPTPEIFTGKNHDKMILQSSIGMCIKAIQELSKDINTIKQDIDYIKQNIK